jgi:hypothetical protein
VFAATVVLAVVALSVDGGVAAVVAVEGAAPDEGSGAAADGAAAGVDGVAEVAPSVMPVDGVAEGAALVSGDVMV